MFFYVVVSIVLFAEFAKVSQFWILVKLNVKFAKLIDWNLIINISNYPIF